MNKKRYTFIQTLKILRGWTNLQNVNVQIAANFHIKQVRILHSNLPLNGDEVHSVWFIRNAVLFKLVRSLAILVRAIVVSMTS